jgi:hypothetical protein
MYRKTLKELLFPGPSLFNIFCEIVGGKIDKEAPERFIPPSSLSENCKRRVYE